MKTLTLSIFLLFAYETSTYSQQAWTNYVNDRLIDDILVDGNHVWVGSQGGLTRTNLETGELTSFLAANSPIVGGGISEIEKAPDGALWFGSENAGIFRYVNDDWTHYHEGIIDSVFNRIQNLQILANGDVWFFVEYGGNRNRHRLIRIREGEVKEFEGLPTDQISFTAVDENTLLFVDDAAIYKYDVGTATVTTTWNNDNSIIEPGDRLWDIRKTVSGILIIPASNYIFQLIDDELTVLSQPGVTVNRSFQDDVGNIYFQSYNNNPDQIRLVKYDGNQLTYYYNDDFNNLPVTGTELPFFSGADSATGLYGVIFNVDSEYTLYRLDAEGWHPVRSQIVPMLDNYQEDVQSDCDGNLWFASRDGVDVRYADGSWGNFTIPTVPYSYFSPRSMTVDPTTCDVWFANTSNSGHPIIPGIIRISNGVVTGFLHDHANVMDIVAGQDGKIYFFSQNSGFGYIEHDQVILIDELELFQLATGLDIDSKGNIYIATWNLQLLRFNGTTFEHLGSGEGGDFVFDVRVDNDDLVWANTLNGLMQFDGVNWHNFNHAIPKGDHNDILQDKRGNYWISTFNDGLYYWDGQSSQHYDIFNSGLTTNHLSKLNLDPQGNLIVTQHVGASVLEIPQVLEVYKGTGNVFFDYNKDGVLNAGTDLLVPGQKVKDVTRNVWAVTNQSGTYAFYSDASTENQFRHEVETAAQSTTANPQDALFVDYNSVLPVFGYWTEEAVDVQMSIDNLVIVCNRDFETYVSLQNQGPHSVEGDVILAYSDVLTVVSSSVAPDESIPGQLTFQNVTLEPFSWQTIKVNFTAPGVDSENIDVSFESQFLIEDTLFTAAAIDTILCSYDPNDKKVQATGEFVRTTSLFSDPLKYTIRFQNEGTYKAFDIVILDTLDAHLDPSSFQLLASSHDVETSVTEDGIIKFVFLNIDLPARSEDELGSQGFVSFTIMPDSNQAMDQTVFNRAAIYFDFNPPILTNNTEWNLTHDLTILGVADPDEQVFMYPNPTDGLVIIHTLSESGYTVWDAAGQLISAGQLYAGKNEIYLNVLPGVYFMEVRNKVGRKEVKRVLRM